MKKAQSMSLTKSLHYQSALKQNNVEENQLNRFNQRLAAKRCRSLSDKRLQWENLQRWAIEMSRTSGYANFHKYMKLIEDNNSNQNEESTSVPSYYFMYGIRIGERPQLMKNFLGWRPQTRSKSKARSTPQSLPDVHGRNEDTCSSATDDSFTTSNGKEPEYNRIMIDNQVVTQVPIGYSRQCKKRHMWYMRCSSASMRQENVRIPDYYSLKHRYVQPPVNMFR